MMSICNTQKMQQYGNKQGDRATATQKTPSTITDGSFGILTRSLNFFQTGKNGSGPSNLQNALQAHSAVNANNNNNMNKYNNFVSNNNNNKSSSTSISASLKGANDRVKTNLSATLAKYGQAQ
ncbi:hypothetical protein ACHWQZ_G014300 [Mnemiopsis leidyi]